jgi:hypothetical protein
MNFSIVAFKAVSYDDLLDEDDLLFLKVFANQRNVVFSDD